MKKPALEVWLRSNERLNQCHCFSETNNKFAYSRFEKLAYQKGDKELTKKISSRP